MLFLPTAGASQSKTGSFGWCHFLFLCATAAAELYTDAIVTSELMHIGHGVDSERLDAVVPPACAFNAAASFLFAKVRQSEVTFFYTRSTCKQNNLTCRSNRRCHHKCCVVFFAASVEKNAALLHVLCDSGLWAHDDSSGTLSSDSDFVAHQQIDWKQKVVNEVKGKTR